LPPNVVPVTKLVCVGRRRAARRRKPRFHLNPSVVECVRIRRRARLSRTMIALDLAAARPARVAAQSTQRSRAASRSAGVAARAEGRSHARKAVIVRVADTSDTASRVGPPRSRLAEDASESETEPSGNANDRLASPRVARARGRRARARRRAPAGARRVRVQNRLPENGPRRNLHELFRAPQPQPRASARPGGGAHRRRDAGRGPERPRVRERRQEASGGPVVGGGRLDHLRASVGDQKRAPRGVRRARE
jgi:hypothetical protein